MIAGLSLGVVAAAALRLGVGPEGLAWPDSAPVWGVRGVRSGAGVVVGAGLGAAGVLLQGLLRNPLASPDLMGLSSGAGLAVTIAAALGYWATGELGTPPGVTAAALVGSLGTLALVYTLSQRRAVIDPVSMVLVGVVVSIVAGSATMLAQHALPDRGVGVSRWFVGRLSEESGAMGVGAVGALVGAWVAWGVWRASALDAATLGDDEARSLGVRLGRLRAGQFVGAGVLTAGTVALAGPIGFVGLVCPHAARALVGPRHALVLPAAALLGAAAVVVADVLVRVIDLGTGQLPLGVVTAVVGGPVFIAMVLRHRG
jgi:iron complex transport system permease protein